MGILKDRLTEAFNTKKSDVNNYLWKGAKVKVGGSFIQEEIKLVDASEEQLKEFKDYCETMLYNKSKTSMGRYLVLSEIQDQRSKCNAELCLRSLEKGENGIPRYKLNMVIGREINSDNKDLLFGDVSTVSSEFSDIPVKLIIDGCIDSLGVFNRKHLTLSFILKQGLWLTSQEFQDLTEYDSDGLIKNRVDVVKKRLKINENIDLKVSGKGLSFSQLRAMLNLKNKKYSEMTTEQLTILRDRMLFNLETEVKRHVKQWEERISQIQEVAELKGFNL